MGVEAVGLRPIQEALMIHEAVAEALGDGQADLGAAAADLLRDGHDGHARPPVTRAIARIARSGLPMSRQTPAGSVETASGPVQISRTPREKLAVGASAYA